MILMIDNYDSFTYNLYQFIGEINPDIKVVRNDKITIDEIEKLHPTHLIISPGPKYPKDAGISLEAIRHFSGKIPILGVCLGHQSIGEAFGSKVVRAKRILHGKISEIYIKQESPIFKGLGEKFVAGRYHSLIIDKKTLSKDLQITAEDSDGEIMAIQHKTHPTYGLQFHPESILTENGKKMIKNFLEVKVSHNHNKYIKKLIEGNDLTYEESIEAMNSIMSGSATEAQMGSLLTALSIRGETVDEITASAKVMREKCNVLKAEGDLLDIVGTGGDCINTFNVSTISSLVVAAAGVKVAKHGNRSISSKCGSADVLEALGAKLDVTKEQSEEILNEINFCFMYAPVYHSAMKYVAAARKQMGVRTIFNILGPLASPALANLQVLGVYSEELVKPMAQVLANLGVKHAMVVHGQDGMDEVSLCAPTTACEVIGKELKSFVINPEELGLGLCKQSDLVGDDAKVNKEIALSILKGEKGPKRDMVLLNSAVALKVALNMDLKEALNLAAEMIDSGKALEKLNEFITKTNSFGQVMA